MEALHTGALRHLLLSPAGATAARALTGEDGVTEVDVLSVRTEARLILGGRRPIDLAASVVAAGKRRELGVEVKVDSAWSAGQLRATVPPRGAHGVLLALGRTRLAITDQDMSHLSGEYEHPWRCVGPDQFAEIVDSCAGDDPQLRSYAGHLRAEAAEHHAARLAVRAGLPVESARDALALGHWAYFGEVLAQREDAWAWDRKTLISGPLVTRWMPELSEGSGDYLEFMGEGARRSLCVKTYSPSGALLAGRARVRSRLSNLTADAFTETKPPAAGAKTCTVARFDLADRTTVDATQLVDRLMDVLR